jgi:hypothetical protein
LARLYVSRDDGNDNVDFVFIPDISLLEGINAIIPRHPAMLTLANPLIHKTNSAISPLKSTFYRS